MKTPRALLLTTLSLLAAAPAFCTEPVVMLSNTTSLPPSVVSSSPESLEAALQHAAPTIRPEALRAALAAWDAMESRGEVTRPLLTVIDYGLPSMAKRMWVFDLTTRQLLFHELVAHGKNSGENLTRSFSNQEGSLMTSLGTFVTGAPYMGKNGYSLRLRGMEPGLNDRAEQRTIVLHGAPYVDDEVAHALGRLGRSHGCPAVRPAIARTLIDQVKDRTLLYAWHPSLNEQVAPAVATASIATHDAARTR